MYSKFTNVKCTIVFLFFVVMDLYNHHHSQPQSASIFLDGHGGALGRQRQQDELKCSSGYVVRPCLKINFHHPKTADTQDLRLSV